MKLLFSLFAATLAIGVGFSNSAHAATITVTKSGIFSIESGPDTLGLDGQSFDLVLEFDSSTVAQTLAGSISSITVESVTLTINGGPSAGISMPSVGQIPTAFAGTLGSGSVQLFDFSIGSPSVTAFDSGISFSGNLFIADATPISAGETISINNFIGIETLSTDPTIFQDLNSQTNYTATNIVFTVVPEPSSLALISLAGFLGMVRRRT